MLVILSVLLFFIIGQFNYYYHDASSIMSAQGKLSKNYVALAADSNNIFESLAKQFGNILKPFEYTVDLSGKQFFQMIP